MVGKRGGEIFSEVLIFFNQFSDIRKIISLIHTYILNYLIWRRSFKNYGIKSPFYKLFIVTICSIHDNRKWYAFTIS